MSLVERNGSVRSFRIGRVTSKNLRQVINRHVEKGSHLMTDDFRAYWPVGKKYASHNVVKHTEGEYSRVDGNTIIHTNTVEGYFSILKRGINGVYHHVGKQHLHRYLSEFDFRYNSREVTLGDHPKPAIDGHLKTGQRRSPPGH